MAAGKIDRQSRKFTALMMLLLGAVAVAAWGRARMTDKISYAEHLDDRAVTVDGTDYTFRDLAVYLAYQEQEISEQAKIYDLEQPEKYWNAHTNGQFIRVAGKNGAMDRAVHDVIFCEMAKQEGTVLSDAEKAFTENQKLDFWNDLEEEGQERLSVSREEIDVLFERIALAQKQQQLYADEQGVDLREYNVNGSLYTELLKEHTYKINEKLWKRLNFGKITIE